MSYLTSQDLSAQILIGPKAGARMNWQSYDDFDESRYKKKPFFGYSAGFTADFKIKDRYSFQVDIMYTRLGKKIEGVADDLLKNTGIYHCLNTPIVYKVDFYETLWGREFKWFLGAGPNVNYWINGKGRLSSVELEEVNIKEVEYDILFKEYPEQSESGNLYIANPNRLQLGLIFSAGIEFEPALGQSILVDLRFEWGHSYLAQESGIFDDVIAYEDNLRASTHGIYLSVCYLFDIVSKGKKVKKAYFEKD
ncbi:MAG: porin family protein [Nitrososphaeraceae archaeon]|nr:porin family protein [Nitrososphaeraceae archaeon]